jgi:hypothetical protein
VDEGVRVITVQGEPEAEALCNLLRQNGIECGQRLTEEEDSAFEGLGPEGRREILVHPRDLDAARSLLNEQQPSAAEPSL